MLLNDISTFIQTSKYSSFNEAAAQTGISIATLSRKISKLEERFGIKLFYRDQSGLQLTESGKKLTDICKPHVESLEHIVSQYDIETVQEKGSIKFIGPANFTKKAFKNNLFKKFFEAYPEINLHFELTPANLNLNSLEFDLAMQIGKLEDSNFVYKTIADIEFLLVASPDFNLKYGFPCTPDDLLTVPLIVFSPALDWEFFSPQKKLMSIQPQGYFVANDIDACINHALSGHGALMLPKYYIENELQSGRLVTLLPDYPVPSRPLNLLWAKRKLPQRTRLLIDYLTETYQSILN